MGDGCPELREAVCFAWHPSKGNVPPWAIPLQSSSAQCIYSSLPKAPLALLWLCLFSARIHKGELRTYQTISVVKRDLSAGRAAGISQVGVGVVDGESTQTWHSERDTAQLVWESRNAAMDPAGGSGSVSFWDGVWHWVQGAGNASAMGTPAGTGQYGSLLPKICSEACFWASPLPPSPLRRQE